MNQIKNKDDSVNDEKLSFLIKEDKDCVKSITLSNGEVVKDNLVFRIYKQRDGKITATISTKSATQDYLEEIFFYEKNLESEKHAYSLLAVMKDII